MNERQIIFRSDMVNAILNNKKVCTRRDRGLNRVNEFPYNFEVIDIEVKLNNAVATFKDRNDGILFQIKCPYGKPGDVLWVRETWRPASSETHECFAYKADNSYQCGKFMPKDEFYKPEWKSPIFMPRKACRLLLQIKSIDLQRLQDMTDDDAIAEGINAEVESPLSLFQSLWSSIHGEKSWELNEWVWVVNFRSFFPRREINQHSKIGLLV